MEYAFALLLVGIAGVGISLIFGYSFSTNDDAMLRNIVNGNYTGTPDAHLIYIMYPLGWILKCLYQIAPVIPWYDLLMIGLYFSFRIGHSYRFAVSCYASVYCFGSRFDFCSNIYFGNG